jgi:hypothetical protein
LVIYLLSLLVKGLTSTQRIKRVTLALGAHVSKTEQYTKLRNSLASLEGVIEAIIDPLDAAIYLKVDAKRFDSEQAEKLIQAQSV